MATYDRATLVRDVLLELSMLDPNESPTAEDYATVDAVCQQQLEALYEDGLIPFDLDGVIPARYQRPLVRVIAYEMVPTFGLLARAELHMIRAREGMVDLRRMREGAYLPAPTRAEYF
jgi:hypothetical protein